MAGLEELEAIEAILGNDVQIVSDGSVVMVKLIVKRDCVVTVQLTETPSIEVTLPDYIDAGALKRHLDNACAQHDGSLLYMLYQTSLDWLDTQMDACTPQQPTSVCKYYLAGKCKFNENCCNLHPASVGTTPSPTTATEDTCPNKGPVDCSDNSEGTKKAPMRTAEDVISRIKWDPKLSEADFTIGYSDRFLGILEKNFGEFSWEDLSSVGIDTLAIPQHRIQYFKYKQLIVWDKRSQVDNFFGSRGGQTIYDMLDKNHYD